MRVLPCKETKLEKCYSYEQIQAEEGVYRSIELDDNTTYLITLHDAWHDSTVVLTYDRIQGILCPTDPECWVDDVFIKVDKQVCFSLV